MKRTGVIVMLSLGLLAVGCSRSSVSRTPSTPTAFGDVIVESSGGKQAASVGMLLPQPVVVQVNDGQGNAVAGALVMMRGPNGVYIEPDSGLTDSSGQFTSTVSMGVVPGRCQLTAITTSKSGIAHEVKIEEIALGYEELVGNQLSERYCARCHNQESTPERVSNYDNLDVKPHSFTDGDTLNKISNTDLIAIVTHGGPAVNRSPLMPPYGYTLSKNEIQALVAYIRMVSDPPYNETPNVGSKSR